jgi:hypothetical protein
LAAIGYEAIKQGFVVTVPLHRRSGRRLFVRGGLVQRDRLLRGYHAIDRACQVAVKHLTADLLRGNYETVI